MYEDDVRPSVQHGHQQTVAAHEAGHFLGLRHIREVRGTPGCIPEPKLYDLLNPLDQNAPACYQDSGGWSPNIMGVGMIVEQENYKSFAGILSGIMPEFEWRVGSWKENVKLG